MTTVSAVAGGRSFSVTSVTSESLTGWLRPRYHAWPGATDADEAP